MKISVVMASYNGEKYIKEQLETIKEQTKKADEVIICDDRSTDATVETVLEYIKENKLSDTWTVVVNEANLGYAANFHKAALMASGDLIFFSDQDDLWLEDKIEIMSEIMENTKDCQVLCTDYLPFCDEGEKQKEAERALKKMQDTKDMEKVSLSKRSVYIGAIGCCMCVRKDFYQKMKPYWFDNWAQDDRMWRLSQCADGCYLLHRKLVKHRLHSNNTATYGKYHTTKKRVALFESMQKADEMMKCVLTDNQADEKKIRMLEKHIEMMKMRIILLNEKKILKSLKLLPYLSYYQEVKSFLVEIYMAAGKN